MELAGGVQQLIHSDLSPNLATLGTWSATDRGRFAPGQFIGFWQLRKLLMLSLQVWCTMKDLVKLFYFQINFAPAL